MSYQTLCLCHLRQPLRTPQLVFFWARFLHNPILHYVHSSWIKKSMVEKKLAFGTRILFSNNTGLFFYLSFLSLKPLSCCAYGLCFSFFMILPASVSRKPAELNCSGHISSNRIKEALCQNGYLTTGVFSAWVFYPITFFSCFKATRDWVCKMWVLVDVCKVTWIKQF